jgi:hypothetical protein
MIQEIDLSGCGLTNAGMGYVMDSIGSSRLTRLDLRGNLLTAEIVPLIQERFPNLKDLKIDDMDSAVPKNAVVSQKATLDLKPAAVERPLRSSPEIPAIARGYEDIYLRFLNGKLIYRPTEGSDVGKIELPIAALSNPLEGEFDLSRCGDTGQYLSINTGYRKGKKTANASKVEIWFVPRFVVEKELRATATHFQKIMTAEKWPESAPIGIFWTWGGWDNFKLNKVI